MFFFVQDIERTKVSVDGGCALRRRGHWEHKLSAVELCDADMMGWVQ